MSSSGAEDQAKAALHERLESLWQSPRGLASLSTVNHTNIGRRYILTGFVYFLIAGMLAMLMRVQLARPNNNIIDAETYNQLFTMHGSTMMFLFAVPIMEAFSVYLLPKMIGARDLVFPRLSAFGYWCYLFGGLFLYSSFLVDAAPDGGWFMYVPLTSKAFTPEMSADFWLLGISFAEIAAVGGAVELIASILKTRTPGMTLNRMPLFAWYILVMAFMIAFGFPPLIMGSILLELERTFGFVFYEAALGGHPLLWQHLFWLFGHPEVYIMLMPAAGIISLIIQTFARRPMIGYAWIVLAAIGTGFISFGLWVHHMFAVGIPMLALSFFSAASMAVVIPNGIQVFAWIATLWRGRPVLSVPLLYIYGFFSIFVLGGLTGVMVAMVPFDWQAHDTHFIVAHMHYVLVGGVVFPLLAAFYYWFPFFSGRMNADTLGRVAFWVIFIGFNLTFLPMHFTGLFGLPRRTYTYPEALGVGDLNLWSTIGAFIMAAGFVVFVIDFILHYRYGRPAGRNPWQAGTLEWALSLPPSSYNFASQPAIRSRDPLWDQPDLIEKIERGAFYLGSPDTNHREMLGTSALDAKPEYVIRLSGPSWTPLLAALSLGLFFLGLLIKVFLLSALGLALALGFFIRWAWENPAPEVGEQVTVAEGQQLPVHSSSARGPGWWGTGIYIMADGALYASLLFAYFYLWTVSPQWPQPGYAPVDPGLPLLAMILLFASGLATQRAWQANQEDQSGRVQIWLSAALVLALPFVLIEYWVFRDYAPQMQAYASVIVTLLGYHGVHLFVASVMAVFVMVRARHGDVCAARPLELSVSLLFWQYMVVMGLLTLGTIVFFPWLTS